MVALASPREGLHHNSRLRYSKHQPQDFTKHQSFLSPLLSSLTRLSNHDDPITYHDELPNNDPNLDQLTPYFLTSEDPKCLDSL